MVRSLCLTEWQSSHFDDQYFLCYYTVITISNMNYTVVVIVRWVTNFRLQTSKYDATVFPSWCSSCYILVSFIACSALCTTLSQFTWYYQHKNVIFEAPGVSHRSQSQVLASVHILSLMLWLVVTGHGCLLMFFDCKDNRQKAKRKQWDYSCVWRQTLNFRWHCVSFDNKFLMEMVRDYSSVSWSFFDRRPSSIQTM